MWGVPVDHERFGEINTQQWLWYYYNLIEDRDDEFNQQRDFVEYHASFIEPDAVRKIREAREESVEVPHEEFVAGIEYFFGREIKLPKERRKGSETVSLDPKSAIKHADNYRQEQVSKNNMKALQTIDYRYWLDLNLE